jgi:hypothetical protein
MERRLISSGAAFEDRVGYSRAVKVGNRVARARPATTGIVTGLLDPRWLVEIEAEAVIG